MSHTHLYGLHVIYLCIIAHEPLYQTYSNVWQAGFHRSFSAHEPPYEIYVYVGLTQARLTQARPNNQTALLVETL